MIDGKMKLKGIRYNADRLSDHMIIVSLLIDSFNSFVLSMLFCNAWKQQQFESLKTAIRKKHLDKPHVKNIIKTLKREYKKGIVHKNGKITPYRVSLK
jgi:hypothetical protein